MHEDIKNQDTANVRITDIAKKLGSVEEASRQVVDGIDTANPQSLQSAAELLDRVLGILNGNDAGESVDERMEATIAGFDTLVDSPIEKHVLELHRLYVRFDSFSTRMQRALEEVSTRQKSVSTSLGYCDPGSVPSFDIDKLEGVESVHVVMDVNSAESTPYTIGGKLYAAARTEAAEPDERYRLEIKVDNSSGYRSESQFSIRDNPKMAKEFVYFLQSSTRGIAGLPDEAQPHGLKEAMNPSSGSTSFSFHSNTSLTLKEKCKWIEDAMSLFLQAKGYETTKIGITEKNEDSKERAEGRALSANQERDAANQEIRKLNVLGLNKKEAEALALAIEYHDKAVSKFSELTASGDSDIGLDPMRAQYKITASESEKLRDLRSYFDGLNEGIDADDSAKVKRSLKGIGRELRKIEKLLAN